MIRIIITITITMAITITVTVTATITVKQLVDRVIMLVGFTIPSSSISSTTRL